MKVAISRSDKESSSFRFHHREVFSDESDGENSHLEIVVETGNQTFRIREGARGIRIEQECEFTREGTKAWSIGLDHYTYRLVACKALAARTLAAREGGGRHDDKREFGV